jgi:hypothetical protein
MLLKINESILGQTMLQQEYQVIGWVKVCLADPAGHRKRSYLPSENRYTKH